MSKLAVTIAGHTYEVVVAPLQSGQDEIQVTVDGERRRVHLPHVKRPFEDLEWVMVDGRPYEIIFGHNLDWLRDYSGIHRLDVRDLEATVARPPSTDGRVKAPIPGLITRVLVNVGDSVRNGQPIIVLEAMKMENEIRAPRDGVVGSLNVEPGQGVIRNEVLAEIE